MKFLELLNEDNSETRTDICVALLHKSHQSLTDALRYIENAYQHCDDKEWQEQLLSFKRTLVDDYGVSDGESTLDNDKPDNLINKISNFINKHSIKDWDASMENSTEEVHKKRFNSKV